MKTLSVTLPALALVVALSGSAMAENGAISTATLNEMGLAGIEMMSDEAAMEIRGQGFSGVFGESFARLSSRFGDTGTSHSYHAESAFMAMGSSFSEAMFIETKIVEQSVNGKVRKMVTTLSLSIGAGGMASASSL